MKNLPVEKIVTEFNAVFAQAMAQRAETEADYVDAVNLEAGVIDGFEDKGEGQSSVVLPDFVNHLRSVSSSITNAIKADPDFPLLTVQSNDERKKMLGDILSKIVRHEWKVSGVYAKLKTLVYLSGVAGYAVARVSWNPKARNRRYSKKVQSVDIGGVCIEPFNPMDFWYDPSGFNRYHIVRRVMTINELNIYAERDEIGLDKAEIAKVQKNERPEIPYSFDLKRTNFDGETKSSEEVEILEICGEWYTTDGELIMENGSMMIANRKYIIKKPTEYDDNGSPYLVMIPVNDGREGYPVSFANPYMALLVSMSELWNLTVDIAREGLPVNAFIGSAFDNPEDLTNGIAPGASYSVQAPGSEVLNRIISSASPQAAMAVFSLATQLTQGMNAGITQAGIPSARGRQTATEVMMAQQQASAVVADLMDGVAESFLLPLVQKTLYLLFDNRTPEDWANANIEWIVGTDNAARLQEPGIFDELYDAISMCMIDVDEPSKSFRRQITLEALTNIFKNLANIAPGWFDVKAFAMDVVRLSGLDPTRYFTKEFSDSLFGNYLLQNGMGGAILDKMNPQNAGGGAPMPTQAPELNAGGVAYNAPGPRNPGGQV